MIRIASTSVHKAAELARLLGVPVEPIVGYQPPVEDGGTFLANARLKAAAGRALAPAGATVVADDSGLEVAALGGAPGVETARYGGDGLDDAGRIAYLLAALGGASDRAASFRCVLVAVLPDGRELIAEGTLDGTIAAERRGAAGFGYDPIFVPAGATRTLAELAPSGKDEISHRGRAAAALRPLLRR